LLPREGTPLRDLDDHHGAWKTAGAELWRASGIQGAEGRETILGILRTLPPELRRALDVDR
jgi:hypothetical protein